MNYTLKHTLIWVAINIPISLLVSPWISIPTLFLTAWSFDFMDRRANKKERIS